ncbi:MAG: ribosomal-protein-alanine N-acetyltransferase [Alphaproteobacteria bacterium]|nr:ribosomal-protein-alanine N-acetyltransferase [Alphaproteobacteria bacterium]
MTTINKGKIVVHNIKLREASPIDAEVMAEIHAECFPHYWNQEAFTDFFAVRGTFAFLVEVEGQVAGFIVVRPQHEQADILTIAVRPVFRGQKIAKTMLEAALTKARANGVEKLFLEVEVGNVAATALYEGAGFAQIDRRKLYYRQKDGTYTDALVMSLRLS